MVNLKEYHVLKEAAHRISIGIVLEDGSKVGTGRAYRPGKLIPFPLSLARRKRSKLWPLRHQVMTSLAIRSTGMAKVLLWRLYICPSVEV